LRRRELPGRVLVITSFTDRRRILPAVAAGARGYLSKDVDPRALVAAVRSVHAGHLLLEPEAAGLLLADPPSRSAGEPTLTARERDVLVLIADGRSNREIAHALTLAEKTVKTHVSSILLKLGLADRTQAALYAVRAGISAGDLRP
jgi:DNA-binding NarL/FixJ family response regulator